MIRECRKNSSQNSISEMSIEGTYLNIIEVMDDKPTANIMPSGGSVLPLFFQQNNSNAGQSN